MTQVGIARTFRADLDRLPGAIARKAKVWLTDYVLNPSDPRFEAHRVERSLMPDLWTAKVDDAYRVIYRQDPDGVRHLLLCDNHDQAYRRAEKLRALHEGGVVEVTETATDGGQPVAAEPPKTTNPPSSPPSSTRFCPPGAIRRPRQGRCRVEDARGQWLDRPGRRPGRA